MPAVVIFGLEILVTCFVGIGIALNARAASGGFVGWMAALIKAVVVNSKEIIVLREIINLARWVTHHVGAQVQTTIAPATAWITGLKTWALTLQGDVFTQPIQLYRVYYKTLTHDIPKAVWNAVKPLYRRAHIAEIKVAKQENALAKAERAVAPIATRVARTTVGTIEQPYVGDWSWIKRHWKALVGAIGLAGLAGATGEMPYGFTIRNLRIHLRRLEKLSLGGLAAGTLAIGLARLGLTHLRCNNNTRFGRALCRTPLNFFNDLLGILADLWVLENICVLIGPLENATETIGKPLVRGLTDATAGLCAGNIGAPVALQGPPVTAPPYQLAAAVAA